MIRGVEQAFKFTTPIDFNDISRIEVVFSQPHNNHAQMPIIKHYDKQVEEVNSWSETDKETTKTYCVGTKYYRYDSTTGAFISSDILPTESDISGGTITTYPLSDDCHISKAYKCDKSYYQFNPDTDKWDITTSAPNTDLIQLARVGVANIPSGTNKKRACIYNQSYHRYNGQEWITSTTEILPIEEISHWDSSKENVYDKDKTYCALETYYKYVDGVWNTYGRPEEVFALNDNCDQSKVYMMKEFYYQYNVVTDQFEKTGVREVYYQYNTTNSQWEECECPCIDAEEIDLWIDTDDHSVSKTYVCKNVYYRYNAGLETPAWEASNNMLVPVIEIDEWVESDYHDTSKIYMCPARYYQYNIEEDMWKEVERVVQPQIVELNYWIDATNRDKNNIYLCGTTYYQYSSEGEKWVSSATFNMQLAQIDYPSETTDPSKIYECSPTYYAHKGGTWESYKNIADAVYNEGFAPVDGDPKSFVTKLTSEETMYFNDKYKGRVQAIVNNVSHPMEYFSVYPTLIDEVTNKA